MGDASGNQSHIVSSSAAYFQCSPFLSLSVGFSMESIFGLQNTYTLPHQWWEGNYFQQSSLFFFFFSLRIKISSLKIFSGGSHMQWPVSPNFQEHRCSSPAGSLEPPHLVWLVGSRSTSFLYSIVCVVGAGKRMYNPLVNLSKELFTGNILSRGHGPNSTFVYVRTHTSSVQCLSPELMISKPLIQASLHSAFRGLC